MFVKLARSSALLVGVIVVALAIGAVFPCRDAVGSWCDRRGDVACW